MTIFFNSYNGAELDTSDKILLQALRYHSGKTIVHRVRHVVRPNDVVFNFGAGKAEFGAGVRVINPSAKIRQMVDKVKFFQSAPIDLVPVWTLEKSVAQAWQNAGRTVVCHTNPDGARGEGVQIVNAPHPLPDVKLYTKYVVHRNEYRVIVVGGKAVYCSERHHTRFERSIMPPPHVAKVAEDLCATMGFDFAGLDVFDLGETALVCEANSAPMVTYAVAAAVAPYLGDLL